MPSQPRRSPAPPPHRAGRWARAAALLLLLTLVAAACSSDGGDPQEAGSTTPSGDAAESAADLPEETFELSTGEEATFEDFLGRPLVVNFFASWCPPCRAEMPDLEEVHQAVADRVTFLGFDLQDTREDGEALVEETGVTYQWAFDPRGDIYRAFEGFAMPTTLWISAAGQILDRDNGAIDADTIRDRIEEHFGVSVQ